jgi:hypothetical protein
LFVDNINDSLITVNVQTNIHASNNPYANDLILIAHIRGTICFSSVENLKSGQAVFQIPKKGIPSGIMHITLFNQQTEPLCERLVFINSHDNLKISVNTDKAIYSPDEEIKMQISVSDNQNKPVEANLSLSVNFANNVDNSTTAKNILNYLLLSSDLKGEIEQAGYYFRDNEANARIALDYLMMTQGWRRFVWQKILKDEFPKIEYEKEKYISIKGKVVKPYLKIPIPYSSVTMNLLSEYNDMLTTSCDMNGEFIFKNLDYSNMMDISIEGKKKSGKQNVLVILEDISSPEINFSPEQFMVENDFVIGKKRKKKNYAIDSISVLEMDKKIKRYRLHRSADVVIEFRENTLYYNVFDVLIGRVPGLSVKFDSGTVMRGENITIMGRKPLFLLDGDPIEATDIVPIEPKDIERIEILYDPNKTSVYEEKGDNGVIAVYLRETRVMSRKEILFHMYGYHKAREFYQPTYTNPEYQNAEKMNSTIYWNPTVKTDSQGQATVTFLKPKQTGSLQTTIEGISPNGSIVFTEKLIDMR